MTTRKTTGTTRKRTTRKPRAPKFTPLPPDAARRMMSPEAQVRFHAIFMGLTPEQRQGAGMVLNAVCGDQALLGEGYRKFFGFWRIYGPNASQDLNITF